MAQYLNGKVKDHSLICKKAQARGIKTFLCRDNEDFIISRLVSKTS